LSESIDWGKVNEYMRTMEEYDKAKTQNAKLFDPKKLVENTRRPRNIVDPELGIITIRPLTLGDLQEINKCETNEEKNIMALFRMLHKTYPDVTIDDVREFGLEEVIRLLKLIAGPQGFLQIQKQSQPGSRPTETPSESVSSRTSFK
jgi:hypothetical protein